jgi:hypothetical protein
VRRSAVEIPKSSTWGQQTKIQTKKENKKMIVSNTKARHNGEWAENTAKETLETLCYNVEVLNHTIDLRINRKVAVEVKSCQANIKARERSGRRRSGRFALEKEQHNELADQNGLYLFIVHNENVVHRMWFAPAKLLDFQPRPTWTEVYYKYKQGIINIV